MNPAAKTLKERCIFTESYNDIYNRMKANYIEQSGIEFDEASEIAVRLKVTAGEIFNAYSTLEWLKRQMFAQTASGEYLDYIAAERGITRRKATKAKGTVTFFTDGANTNPVFLPKGTVVVAPGTNPVRIYTTEDAEIPLMTQSKIVEAEAELPGFSGNILAGVELIPVSVPPEVERVTNYSRFTGGAEEESDTSLRERIKETFFSVPNGTNKSYYRGLALSVDGVDKAGVVSGGRGVGSLDIYVCGNEQSVSQNVINEVKSLIDSKRELGISVQVLNANAVPYDLYVTLTAKAGYSSDDVTSICSDAFAEYISNIPIGGKLYLSSLGRYLLETNCIENYEFDMSMSNMTISGSQFFTCGEISIEVV